jgi:hypothetical protein
MMMKSVSREIEKACPVVSRVSWSKVWPTAVVHADDVIVNIDVDNTVERKAKVGNGTHVNPCLRCQHLMRRLVPSVVDVLLLIVETS